MLVRGFLFIGHCYALSMSEFPPPPPSSEPEEPETGSLVPVEAGETAEEQAEGEPEVTPLIDEHLVPREETSEEKAARANEERAQKEEVLKNLKAQAVELEKNKEKTDGTAPKPEQKKRPRAGRAGGNISRAVAAGLVGVPAGVIGASAAAGGIAFAKAGVEAVHGHAQASASAMATSKTLFGPAAWFFKIVEGPMIMLWFAKSLPNLFERILSSTGISSGKGDHAPKKAKPAASGGGGGGGHH